MLNGGPGCPLVASCPAGGVDWKVLDQAETRRSGQLYGRVGGSLQPVSSVSQTSSTENCRSTGHCKHASMGNYRKMCCHRVCIAFASRGASFAFWLAAGAHLVRLQSPQSRGAAMRLQMPLRLHVKLELFRGWRWRWGNGQMLQFHVVCEGSFVKLYVGSMFLKVMPILRQNQSSMFLSLLLEASPEKEWQSRTKLRILLHQSYQL